MAVIGVYDHRTEAFSINGTMTRKAGGLVTTFEALRQVLLPDIQIRLIERSVPIAQEVETLSDELADADLVVAHFRGGHTAWDEFVRNSRPGSVCLRTTSSVGSGRQPVRILNGVLALELQQSHNDLVDGDWELLVRGLCDATTLDTLRAGSVPEALAAFLTAPSAPEFLQALSVLCQGYLAAWRTGNVATPANALPVDVERALALMGWEDGLASVLGATPDVQKRVAEPEYWNVFGDERGSILNRMRREWLDIGPGQFDRVERLINSMSVAIDDVTTVAQAYLDLADHQGRRR